MSTIVTRSGKGSPLTNTEVDANFTNLNTDKLELSGGTLTGNVNFGDNDKAIFGAGSDLEIYHDGSNSYVKDAGTGNLNLQGENLVLENTAGDNYFVGVNGSFVKLYYSGSEKLATTSYGADITGRLVTTSHIDAPDNARIRLGDGDDLQIYHDGSNSYIKDVGTGNLNIDASNLSLRSWDGAESYIDLVDNSYVQIRHNNAIKLATTSTGIDVTGETDTDTLNVSGASTFGDNLVLNGANLYLQDTHKAIFGNGSDLEIYHSGSNSFIREVGTGNLNISTNGSELALLTQGGLEYGVRIIQDGAVQIRHDDSTKLATTSTGIDVTGTAVTDAVDLTAIAKDISDTAVDVFVYDTSKDSDGGAWRKRTQATSWYNETLNTSTRGSRKEFPAVAVIVAESDTVTIYDGDDPDMPMWMVFNQGGSWSSTANLIMPTSASDPLAISLLNGVLSIGFSNGYGFGILNFISEHNVTLFANVTQNYRGNISQRNDQLGFSVSSDTRLIVNSAINDVAMTVLPNAPIDSATGLPVPTIAVATDGGVSVIKDDGTVVGITNTSSSKKVVSVNFQGNDRIVFSSNDNGYNYIRGLSTLDIPDSNLSGANFKDITTRYAWASGTGIVIPNIEGGAYSNNHKNVITDSCIAIGRDAGITLLDENTTTPANGSVAYITSTFNTGWMNGDIKLATLSDTDDTDVTGAELVDQTSSGWSKPTGYSHNGSGTLTAASNTGQYSKAYDVITSFVVGKVYTLTFNVTAKSGSWSFWVNDSASYSNNWTATNEVSGTGVKSHTFTAADTTGFVVFQCNALGNTITVSDISVRLAEEDRSVNGNGLQVFGTVTKNPVATGADLVGYGGFSTSNYLQHTASTNYGSAAVISFMCWMKTTDISNYQYAGSLIDGTSGSLLGLSINATGVTDAGRPYLFDSVNGSLASSSGPRLDDGVWHCVVGVVDGTVKKLYIDGVLNTSSTGTALAMTNVTNTNVGFYSPSIGGTRQYYYLGSLALVRISATAPSAEQIAKMYNDEKVLFQENAQATLYGSSDAVTALAHDDTTDLLHVGTSAGRSVFQGLRRVDNTTTAVGATISASNGLVAED